MLIELLDGRANGAGVIGSAAATRTDDIRAGGEDVGNGAGGFFGRLFVDGFEIFQNGKAGVRLNHGRELAAFAIEADDFGCARHVHARATVERDDVRAASLDEFGSLLGSNAHHGFVEGAVGGKIVSERTDDAGSAGGFGGINGKTQFFERCLGLDDDGVHAGIDERGGLLVERGAGVGFGKLAIRFQNCAKGPDVAEDVTGTFSESVFGDANTGLVDLAKILVVTMTLEHERAAAEGVGDEAIGTRVDVAALDGENALGMSQVPEFAAVARFEAGEHQLRAHRSIANEATFKDGFVKRLFHNWTD